MATDPKVLKYSRAEKEAYRRAIGGMVGPVTLEAHRVAQKIGLSDEQALQVKEAMNDFMNDQYFKTKTFFGL